MRRYSARLDVLFIFFCVRVMKAEKRPCMHSLVSDYVTRLCVNVLAKYFNSVARARLV